MLDVYKNGQHDFACLSSNSTNQTISEYKTLEVRGSSKSVLYIKALNTT